jgi:transposase
LKVYLRSVQEALLLTRQVFTNKDGSQGCLYLITSDTALSYDQITTIYQRRWKVEEYHKSLKQNASFGDSPTKNPDTQSNHFFASMLAYIKLEALKAQTLHRPFPNQGPTLYGRPQSHAPATNRPQIV